MNFVKMHHPESGNNAEATEQAFNEVYVSRGWVLLADAPLEESMTKDELVGLAADQGVDVSDAKTKSDLAKKIKDGA